MLDSVFFSILPRITSSRFRKELMKGLEDSSVKKMRSLFPSWSRTKTLEYLKGSVFELLSSCDWKNLTKKTFFLVALATAKRNGELQAFSHSISFQREDSVLSYLPGFVAKTEIVKIFVARSCRLKSWEWDEKAQSNKDSLLWPVRTLKIYLLRFKVVSPRPRSLLSPLGSVQKRLRGTPSRSFSEEPLFKQVLYLQINIERMTSGASYKRLLLDKLAP